PVTIEASTARHVMKTDDAVTFLPTANPAANGGDSAGDLVSEYLWRSNEAMLYFFQICPADAAGGHPNQEFARGDCWNRNIPGRHAPRAAIHSRTHLLG